MSRLAENFVLAHALMACGREPRPGHAQRRRATVSFPKTRHRVNFAGKILGLRGQNLKAIEARTQTRIFIESTAPQVLIQGSRVEEARHIIETIVDDALWEYTWNGMRFRTDWERFYVWWYFHNRIGRRGADGAGGSAP